MLVHGKQSNTAFKDFIVMRSFMFVSVQVMTHISVIINFPFQIYLGLSNKLDFDIQVCLSCFLFYFTAYEPNDNVDMLKSVKTGIRNFFFLHVSKPNIKRLLNWINTIREIGKDYF